MSTYNPIKGFLTICFYTLVSLPVVVALAIWVKPLWLQIAVVGILESACIMGAIIIVGGSSKQ